MMKRYLLLHYGFEKPTPDIMAAWREWFSAVASRTVENVGPARGARNITLRRDRPPMGRDSITGYTIIEAQDLDEAESLAHTNPFIASIRIYEIAAH